MIHLATFLAFFDLLFTTSALPVTDSGATAGFVSFAFTKALRPRFSSLRPRQNDFITTPISNNVYDYLIHVNVGSPPQQFDMLLDTGSSDIFVFDSSCNGCSSSSYFTPSASDTFQSMSDLGNFGIGYADGSSVQGYYGADQVGIGNVVAPQTIGIATKQNGDSFEGGIFGIGLDDGESITNSGQSSYPGYISTLKNYNLIATRAYSLFLNSRSPNDHATGVIIFGAYDTSKWTGDMVYFPMIEKAPDGQYRLDVLEPVLSYGIGDGLVSIDEVNHKYTVLLDTGTPISYIPEKQFNVIAEVVNAQIIGDGPIYSVDCSLAQAPDGMNFDFEGPAGSLTIGVPWNELVVPSDNPESDGRCFFGLAPSTNEVANGVYTLGDTFIRSTYLLFDYDALVVGIAQANYDHQKRSEIVAF